MAVSSFYRNSRPSQLMNTRFGYFCGMASRAVRRTCAGHVPKAKGATPQSFDLLDACLRFDKALFSHRLIRSIARIAISKSLPSAFSKLLSQKTHRDGPPGSGAGRNDIRRRRAIARRAGNHRRLQTRLPPGTRSFRAGLGQLQFAGGHHTPRRHPLIK
jgi:hypothetical protein